MNYRPLGRTGLVVSEIGFGAWGIGGRTVEQTSYGDTDDVVSLAALARALDRGITFFDTSDRPPDFSPASIVASTERSLRRLGTDYLDLQQLHNPPLEVLTAPEVR